MEEQQEDVEYEAGQKRDEKYSNLPLLSARYVFLHVVAVLSRFLFATARLLFVIFLAS